MTDNFCKSLKFLTSIWTSRDLVVTLHEGINRRIRQNATGHSYCHLLAWHVYYSVLAHKEIVFHKLSFTWRTVSLGKALWCKLALNEFPRLILHKLCFDLFSLQHCWHSLNSDTNVDFWGFTLPRTCCRDHVSQLVSQRERKPWATAQLKRMDEWNF